MEQHTQRDDRLTMGFIWKKIPTDQYSHKNEIYLDHYSLYINFMIQIQ